MIRKRFNLTPRSIILLSLLSISIFHRTVLADEMIPVLDVYSNSTNGSFYHEYNLIDGSGLSGDYHDNQYENMWMGEQYELPILKFDLGSVYAVSELKIWQYNYDYFSDLLNRGVKDFDVYGSIDNIYGTLLFSGTLTKSPGGQILPESFPISEDVRYLQIQIASNYGDDYTGLSEVQIFGTQSEDNDSDGLPDSWEIYYYLDPFFDDSLIDTDGDGINNLDEYLDSSNPQNNVPEQPILLSPVNRQDDVSLTPTLRSNVFIDPDANDTHAYTHWQISLESSFTIENQIIGDVFSDVELTELSIPDNVLTPGTTYYCRLRFIDGNYESSIWSDTVLFTTKMSVSADGGESEGGGGGGGCFISNILHR